MMNERVGSSAHSPQVHVARLGVMGCAAIVGIYLLGCAPDATIGKVIQHPNDESIVREVDRGFIISKSLDKPPIDAIRFGSEELSRGTTIGVGVLEGPDTAIFGKIEDGAITRTGEIIVLDSRMMQLRVYATDGKLLATGGQHGLGPGEFRAPSALDVDDENHVYVADRNAIHIFDWLGDSLLYRQTLHLQIGVLDLCTLGNIVFVHGLDLEAGGKVIHRLGSDGEFTLSVGDIYDSESEFTTMRRGRIACATEAEVVAFAAGYFPEIHAWTPEGKPLWVTSIADWLLFDIEERPSEKSMAVTVSNTGSHFPRNFVADGKFIILDLALRTLEGVLGKVEFVELDRYVLDASNGKGAYIGATQALFLAARGEIVITTEHDPFPRMLIHHMAGGGR